MRMRHRFEQTSIFRSECDLCGEGWVHSSPEPMGCRGYRTKNKKNNETTETSFATGPEDISQR